MQTMADNGTLTVLTDVWSKSVAKELVHRWPDHRIEVRYLREEANWRGSECPPSIKATQLDPDVSSIFLSDGTRFAYALNAHTWELTKLFHRTVLKESTWARRIGRFYSSRCAEVLYLRNFDGRAWSWVFLCLFAHHLRETGPDSSEASPIVFLSSNPFGEEVVNYLQGIYAPIVVGPGLSYTKMLYIQARMVLGGVLRLIRRLQQQRQLPTGRSSATLPMAVEPHSRRAIAVEACWGLEPEKERSDLFWLPQSGIPDDQILVYFDRPDTPASDEALAIMQGHGWQPVVLRRDIGTVAAAMFRSYFRRLDWRRLLLILLSSPFWLLEQPRLRGTAHWCWQCVARSAALAAIWQAFFASHGVRLHSDYADLGVEQSVALEWQGGLNLRTDNTFTYSPALRFAWRALPFDVFFAWGPYLASALQELDFAGITTLVTCGYLFDYLFESARPRAAGLRRELQAAGAHKIVCFFDSTFTKTTWTSRQEVEDVYRALLTEVVENPLLGLVLKPKQIRSGTVLETPELRGLLDKALGTGRCAILEHKSYMHQVSPCEAALVSDLAIGYPINSAVIEAVLAGVPGVHIDLTKQHSHQFYEVGYEKFVFDDLDRAMDAIRRWIRNPANEPGLGDHSAVIEQIDPFRDGKAARRMGQYMASLLEGFDQGLHRDDVVRRASRLYAEKYGAQHVRLAPRLGRL